MEEVNDKYYVGLGEPEIHIILETKEVTKKFVIWDAYFDRIMERVRPDKNGFTSLARHYNMLTGWMEESPWKVDDPAAAYAQLKSIDTTGMQAKTKEVYDIICEMFKEAITNHFNIYIAMD